MEMWSKTLIALVLVGAVAGGMYFTATGRSPFSLFGGQGFFVLSSGQTQFLSNDEQITGKFWLITVSQKGAGGYVVGTFDGTSIRTVNEHAQYPLKLEANLLNNYYTWNIKQNGKTLRNLQYEEKSCTLACDWNARKNNCFAAHPGATWHQQTSLLSGTGWCIFWRDLRPVADFDIVKNYIFNTELKSTVNGQVVTANISNVGSQSVWLGDKVYATWNGNLVSGVSIDRPADTSFVWHDFEGWRTVSTSALNTYFNYETSGLVTALGTCPTNADPLGCVRTALARDRDFEAIADQKKDVSFVGGYTASTSGTIASGTFKIDVPQQLQFPVLTMKVKASWIGVVQLVGQPKINSVTLPANIESGKPTTATISVSNVGSSAGSFNVFITCNAPLSSSFSQRITLEPGASTTLYAPVTASCNADSSGTCTVTAQDVNNPSSADSKQAGSLCKTVVTCNLGETRCVGNNVEVCSQVSGAFGFVTQKNCNYGCSMTGNNAVCNDKPVPCTTDADCNDNDATTTDTCSKGLLETKCIHTSIIPPPDFGILPFVFLGIVGIVVVVLVFTKKKKGRR